MSEYGTHDHATWGPGSAWGPERAHARERVLAATLRHQARPRASKASELEESRALMKAMIASIHDLTRQLAAMKAQVEASQRERIAARALLEEIAGPLDQHDATSIETTRISAEDFEAISSYED